MNVTLLLCDWAEAINGKLYIQGGGWSRLRANAAIPVALAAKIDVDWDKANMRMPLRLSLVTDDGEPALTDGEPFDVQGEFEVGRPPGIRRGTSIDAPLVFRFQLNLPQGVYSFVLDVAGKELGRVTFDVVEGSP